MGDVRGEKTARKSQPGHPEQGKGLSAKLSWIPLCRGELLKSFEEGSEMWRAKLSVYRGRNDWRDSVRKEVLFPFDQFPSSQSGLAESHHN